MDNKNPIRDIVPVDKGKRKFEDVSAAQNEKGILTNIFVNDRDSCNGFLGKVVDLINDNDFNSTPSIVKESRKSVEIQNRKEEINKHLLHARSRKTTLHSLFSSRCISSRLWSTKARQMHLSKHMIIQKFIHAIKKEEHFWLLNFGRLCMMKKKMAAWSIIKK